MACVETAMKPKVGASSATANPQAAAQFWAHPAFFVCMSCGEQHGSCGAMCVPGAADMSSAIAADMPIIGHDACAAAAATGPSARANVARMASTIRIFANLTHQRTAVI